MRIAFVFGSIPTRNNRETDLRKAVVDKKDWLGQEAEHVATALAHRHPGSATSIHILYPVEACVESRGVEWLATRPMWPMTYRYFYQGKQWSARFHRALLDWKPDLVHWQMNSYAYTFHLAARSFVKRGIPYLYQHHGAYLARKWWVRKALQYPHDHALMGIYSIDHYAEEYRRGLNLDPAKTCVIPVGFDGAIFRKMDRAQCRAKTGFTGDPTLFWCHGLTKRKDPLTALAAYERVVDEFPSSRFYMAGAGVLESEVKAFVQARPKLRDHVTLLGWVNNADVPAMANASDLFVMASRGEAYGISSMEAMACGAFPVMTAIPSLIEQTEGGRLGLLFPPGDVDACAAQMRKAMGDVAFREGIRAELPAAMERRSWARRAEQIVDLYERVLNVRSHAATASASRSVPETRTGSARASSGGDAAVAARG